MQYETIFYVFLKKAIDSFSGQSIVSALTALAYDILVNSFKEIYCCIVLFLLCFMHIVSFGAGMTTLFGFSKNFKFTGIAEFQKKGRQKKT